MAEPHPMCGTCDHCGGDGHQSPCEDLNAQKGKIDQMAIDLARMREILEAWNNAKGFISTLNWLGRAAKWLTTIAAGLAVVLVLLDWMRGR